MGASGSHQTATKESIPKSKLKEKLFDWMPEENPVVVVPEHTEYNYKTLICPKDSEGYIVSFQPHQLDEIKSFFEEYGLVVVSDILTAEECAKTEDEVWDYVKQNSSDVSRSDPSTWHKWPWGGKLGILGNLPILSSQAMKNRQNPKMHQKVFAALFGSPKLWVSVDRIGMMRPTKGVKFSDSESPKDVPEWKSIEEWLHLDMNPLTGKVSSFAWGPDLMNNKHIGDGDNSILKVQGILALVDCTESEGGFHCVPGFQKHALGWARKNYDRCIQAAKMMDHTTVQIGKDDPIRKDIQKMPLRKGSLLIWNSRLPHGTFPNDSDKFRMIQYMKMGLTSDPTIEPACLGLESTPKDLTLLGERLLGYEHWD